jgi:hypothetical protein
VIEPDAYCREIEAYLCRKNDGHLIRIVGPSFDLVSGWARAGIPITVARAGIDRYFERYYRRGRRRRPVRIEFCEADVLDAFDDWRRAVGVVRPRASAEADGDAQESTAARRGPSLGAHVERALARLTLMRSSGAAHGLPSEVVERGVRTLDGLQARARRARGETREAIIAELVALDTFLVDAALAMAVPEERADLETEAAGELAPFRVRMPEGAYARALHAAVARLIRERRGIPRISFE